MTNKAESAAEDARSCFQAISGSHLREVIWASCDEIWPFDARHRVCWKLRFNIRKPGIRVVDQWQREFVKLVLNRPAISRTSGRRTWLRVARITEGDSSAGGVKRSTRSQ